MNIRTILTLGIIAIALALISLWMGQQAYSWFPPQASAEAVLVDQLFSFLVTLGTFIFLGVVGTLTYSVLFQQAGKYDFSDGPHIEGNVPLEIVWTAIPFVLVIWIAGYSYQIYDQMSILGPMEHVHMGMPPAEAAPLEASPDQPSVESIEVYARQWAWEFHYPQPAITSTELHLPNRQRIKLALHSEDVLHGFFVPAFRVKQDIIPGQVIEFEFTPIREGRYRLRDSQYSGTYFAAMQTDVVVESPEAYQQWLAAVATQPPVAAYNRAFDEYQRAHNPIRAGWKIVEPAPPPIVNSPSFQASTP
ncbi:cytochrome c oxidase subunit II [Desertifilum sp. FACHB-1129]|uniref:cytochrome c oxidase subunit II n=1 Tax=unclassified Desertifilum TaxID=2621682 RepID=UPI00168577F7|nr:MULTISPECIES: cytochrome c oxidase subunit II [unclassified Desertifilum]MBD2311188.1 cytochrome c oxidase subunit II [Desertifilum sp. FACHB-1129]MBD2324367.1 cytochrome c oxidase subunit II [Desertifilum sp. FACHB-866]MBD2334381.1 cytochrome c oxidase subunit II [Desertifilum sp. FACHB-868]MDA0213228.1 cytochrome c oxidase subunit II [Cyanobacteria bacterium FC1]